MAKRQVTSPSGGKYWVADEADLSEAERASAWWPEAPEPWRSAIALRWFKPPLYQFDPWTRFPIDEDETEDQRWVEYVTVVGPMLQRVPWVQAGGSRAHWVGANSNYLQDFKLFHGIVDAPASIAGKVDLAADEFKAYGMGVPYCYLTLSGNPAYGPGPVVNLFFPAAKLEPKVSEDRGFFHWIHEGAEFDFNVTIIIANYQKVLIQGGVEPAVRHPSLQGWQPR